MYAYAYNSKTKEAVKNSDGSYKKIQLQEDQLNGGYLPHPKGTLPIAPPEVDEYQAAVADEDKGVWDIVADYRGIWYNKETKEELVIKEFGLVEEIENYTKNKPDAYNTWDEKKGEWIFDIEKYKKNVVNDINIYSFSIKEALFPNYKFINLLSGIQYNKPYTIEGHKKLIKTCKKIVHSFEDSVQTQKTKDEVDKLYRTYLEKFPKSI